MISYKVYSMLLSILFYFVLGLTTVLMNLLCSEILLYDAARLFISRLLMCVDLGPATVDLYQPAAVSDVTL